MVDAVVRKIRSLGLWAWYAVALFIILSAIALTAARFVLPRAHEYTQNVQQLLSDNLKTPVQIGLLDARWHRFGPQLLVRDVRVLDAAGTQEIARFDVARLDFDVWGWLRHGRLGLSGVEISGVHAIVERTPEGQIRLAALGGVAPDAATDHTQVAQWLFGQLQWQIIDSSLEWRDRMRDSAPLVFTHISAHLRNDGEQHELQGVLTLPGTLGEQFVFSVDISGDPLLPDSWTGRSYAGGKNLQMVNVLREIHGQSENPVTGGTLDAQLWARWERGLAQVSGDVSARDIKFSAVDERAEAALLSGAASQVLWQRRDTGWAFAVDQLTVTRENRSWPETRARVVMSRAAPDASPRIEAQASFLRVEDVVAVGTSWPQVEGALREMLAQSRPHGDARDVALTWRNDAAAAEYQVAADVLGLGMSPWKSLPGFSGVAGSVVAQSQGGSLQLSSPSAVLELPKIFRGPLPLGSVRGRVYWTVDAAQGAWRVVSDDLVVQSPDADVLASVDVGAPDAQTPPYLDLVANYKDGDGRRTSRYLPTAIMPQKVVNWLDQSIKEGHITGGGVVVHGRVDQFPFANGEGRFEVRGQITEGVLDYLPEWPMLSHIDAELVFSGHSMEVHGKSAQILGSAVSDVFVAIPDMGSEYAILTVAGNVRGESKDPLAFLQIAPPLRESIGRDLSDILVQGKSDLHLDLAIPLGRSIHLSPRVTAHVALNDNALNLGSWGQLLNHVDGVLTIDNDGIRGDQITARVLGQPATLEIRTQPGDEGSQIVVKSRGTLAPRSLLARFKPEWSDYFQGEGRVVANLKIPLHAGGTSVKTLRVEALWDNVNVRLPEPLAKPRGENLFVEVNADLGATEQKLYVQYGNRVSAALQLVNEHDTIQVARGELHFGEGRASLPRPPGLRVNGSVERFSVDEWRAIPGVEALLNGNEAKKGSAPKRPLYDLDTHANQLIAFGQTLNDARLKVIRGAKEWRATVNSREFAGQVRVPFETAQAPIVMDLERWIYAPAENTKTAALDPRDLPAVEIKSDRFMYGKVDFGRLQLKASKFAFGWRVDKLEMVAPLTMVNGSGAWTYDGKQHQSRFDLDVISEDIGATMSTFGYADSIVGGNGRINLHAAWAAPLPDVVPEIIDGKLTMEFKKGRMLDLNPGAGRLFALLSIQALPRRLALDFTDLFSKGFAFDDIKGDFRLEHGEAYTSNLAMNGPAAKVRAAGRVGLTDHDYDQRVHVVPDLTGSVPTLTTFAISPQIGIATFVLGKIFQTQIDQVTGVDYTITGSWDNPQIDRVSVAPPTLPSPQ